MRTPNFIQNSEEELREARESAFSNNPVKGEKIKE
jgi:hypothetical protein